MLDLDSYFARIGHDGPRAPTLETLRELQRKHPLAIPFENLDTLSGTPVRLDLESLERKLVRGRRGGYCFEQNLLLKHVLTRLGFDVVALAARVVWERPAGEPRPRSHMVLLVSLGGRRYLCDVGFGGLTPTGPIGTRGKGRKERVALPTVQAWCRPPMSRAVGGRRPQKTPGKSRPARFVAVGPPTATDAKTQRRRALRAAGRQRPLRA